MYTYYLGNLLFQSQNNQIEGMCVWRHAIQWRDESHFLHIDFYRHIGLFEGNRVGILTFKNASSLYYNPLIKEHFQLGYQIGHFQLFKK